VRSVGGLGRPAVARLRTGLVGVAVAAVLLTGCGGYRSDLGTSDSSCYLALPAATKAVGGHGRLIGVHLTTLEAIDKRSSPLATIFKGHPHSKQRICVTAFSGHFVRSSVTKPLGAESGPVAVVASKVPSNRVLGTAILSRPPPRFSHTHIG
jgi:hypothetical protein